MHNSNGQLIKDGAYSENPEHSTLSLRRSTERLADSVYRQNGNDNGQIDLERSFPKHMTNEAT